MCLGLCVPCLSSDSELVVTLCWVYALYAYWSRIGVRLVFENSSASVMLLGFLRESELEGSTLVSHELRESV